METSTIRFWFEFASTYSYPAAARLQSMALKGPYTITWTPFLLGPIFAAQGWQDSPFNLFEAKGRYMWRDLERICAHSQLPFRRPSQFPRNGLKAARVATAGLAQPWLPEFVAAVYRANFAEDRDIGRAEVVGEILSDLDLDAAGITESAETPATKDLLRRNTEQAGQHGIFGAPSFSVGEELFWGNDRLEAALRFAGIQTEPS